MPTSSMCPNTKCPEFRSPVLADRSRFMRSPSLVFPKMVMLRDSFIISTVKVCLLKSIMVQQVPERATDSPFVRGSEKECVMVKRLFSIFFIFPVSVMMPVNMRCWISFFFIFFRK